MSQFRVLMATLALLPGMVFAQADRQPHGPTVSISGAVLKPGTYRFAEGARLADASATGQVSSRAWPPGAALLRQGQLDAQQRLKAGILFELQTNQVHARAEGKLPLQALTAHLHQLIDAMPVTGRVVAELTPLQQLIAPNNLLLKDGDVLVYPQKPSQVRVLGAVVESCTLKHAPAVQPGAYLRQCPQHRLADPGFIYLVQPDGTWRKLGNAAWNLEPAYVAAGAVIYVPLLDSALAPGTTALNDDIAALLATQYRLGGRFED